MISLFCDIFVGTNKISTLAYTPLQAEKEQNMYASPKQTHSVDTALTSEP